MYASVCDGIGAAHAAWVGHLPDWRCAWTSEIEPFPSAVVEARYGFPNLGDMLKITQKDCEKYGPIDLLVGGTPCQSFSVAGLRGGLGDARGNLALRFSQLASVLRPRWLVWENVPGVLSSGGGRDFGSILGAMAELGYGCAYRVLDAQYFGLAQRRKRVFVVGCLGDWRRAAAVLVERAGLRGDPAPGRETRADVAGTLGGGTSQRGWNDDLDRAGAFVECIKGDAIGRKPEAGPQYGEVLSDGSCYTLNCTELHAVAYQCHGSNVGEMGTLRTGNGHLTGGVPFVDVGYAIPHQGKGYHENVAYTIESRPKVQSVASSYGVRRLTPRECERLQGFPDDYTLIDFKGKPAADGNRYKALGNSMAVPVMRWIGRRIDAVDRREFGVSPLTAKERLDIFDTIIGRDP